MLLPPTSHIKTIPNTHNHPSTFFTSSKLTMAFEGGLASDLVSASVPRPAPVGQPTSQGGPQAEFHVTERAGLLKTLKNALDADIPPTVWACLWLSDIDKLKKLAEMAKWQPVMSLVYFKSIESDAKIVQKCEVYRLPCVLIIDLLILYREPTTAQAFCRSNSSTTIYSAGPTFPTSLNATTISSTVIIYSAGPTFPNSTISLNATTISSTVTIYFTE